LFIRGDLKVSGGVLFLSAIEPTMRIADLRRQVPTFAAVGAFGYVVDSALTYAFVKIAHVDPLVARLPAFVIATVFNFLLNRKLTFSASRTPIGQAFVRYAMVCAVGLLINWTAYATALSLAARFGLPATPETLPLFVAAGTGVAMFATFFGFKQFAFRA
jgi:putative flippase GtrA